MRRLARRILKAAALGAWAGAFALVATIQSGRLDRAGEPLWAYERRELATAASPARRVVSHEAVMASAGQQDGARLFLRCASVSRHRGVLRLTASSIAYPIDAPAPAGPALASSLEPPHPGLDRYANDATVLHGVWRADAPIPYARWFGSAGQLVTRFPITADDDDVRHDPAGLATAPGDHSPRHTFTRTNDALSQGWDLDVRLPFWLIYLTLAAPALFVALARTARALRRRHRRRLGRCAHCGYDRRGLPSARCPECGRDAPGN